MTTSVWGQPSIQFPQTAPPATGVPAPSSGWSTPVSPNLGVTTPGTVPSIGAPPPGSAALGTVSPFDPYSPHGAAAQQFWGTPSGPVIPATPVTPMPNSPLVPAPSGAVPYASPYGPPVPVTPGQQPAVIFPNGVYQGQPYDWNQSLRLVQDVRLRHTWLYGNDKPLDLQIHDTELAVTFALPNFLTSGQPLYVTPAFALHLWDGPDNGTADLPANAYSAFLDFQWQTNPQYQVGAELGVRVGAYSDFNTFTDDSFRIQGLGLGVARLTPTVTFKAGVIYLDRNDIKLLPAGGILWQPNPQVRFDIFFPQPKLSAYLTNLGSHEVWWYIAGEYGGGAWTVERAAGGVDRVDINDIRVSGGLEGFGPRGFNWFFEVGYVFERELVFVVDPTDTTDLNDTFMLRAGIAY